MALLKRRILTVFLFRSNECMKAHGISSWAVKLPWCIWSLSNAVAVKLHNSYSRDQTNIKSFYWMEKRKYFYICPVIVVWWCTTTHARPFTTVRNPLKCSWATLYKVQYVLFHSNGPSSYIFLFLWKNWPCFLQSVVVPNTCLFGIWKMSSIFSLGR
jgi:hypothetical protein